MSYSPRIEAPDQAAVVKPNSRRKELLQVSAGLAAEGGGTAVMARLIAATAADFAGTAGAPFRVLSLADTRSSSPGLAIECFSGNKMALALAVWGRQIRGSCAGIIFDHPGPARLQAALPLSLRARYLVFLYGIDIWRTAGWGRARSLQGAHAAVTISEYSRAEMRQAYPGLSPVHLLYPALEPTDASEPWDEAIVDAAGRGYLLVVGRMSAGERYKGHDQLLEAMPRILESAPDARLVVVGEGDDRHRLEVRAREMRLGHRVIFTGFVDEPTLQELYRRSAVFVMPSCEEGFGLVYLEAMKAAKPCVAARGSAAEEIVIDGATGLLVDKNDTAALATACEQLLARPERARKLGQSGYQRWQQVFSQASFRAGLWERLQDLTGWTDVRD